MRKLLKISVNHDGNKGWTLQSDVGEKTFYGSSEEFVSLLKRLKVSDDTMNPKSYRNLKYADIVTGITDMSCPCIHVWSNIWDKNKKTILNR